MNRLLRPLILLCSVGVLCLVFWFGYGLGGAVMREELHNDDFPFTYTIAEQQRAIDSLKLVIDSLNQRGDGK